MKSLEIIKRLFIEIMYPGSSSSFSSFFVERILVKIEEQITEAVQSIAFDLAIRADTFKVQADKEKKWIGNRSDEKATEDARSKVGKTHMTKEKWTATHHTVDQLLSAKIG